jgi:hypothetical protein
MGQPFTPFDNDNLNVCNQPSQVGWLDRPYIYYRQPEPRALSYGLHELWPSRRAIPPISLA